MRTQKGERRRGFFSWFLDGFECLVQFDFKSWSSFVINGNCIWQRDSPRPAGHRAPSNCLIFLAINIINRQSELDGVLLNGKTIISRCPSDMIRWKKELIVRWSETFSSPSMTIDDRKTFPVDRNMAPYAMIWSVNELLTDSVIIGRITLLDGCWGVIIFCM